MRRFRSVATAAALACAAALALGPVMTTAAPKSGTMKWIVNGPAVDTLVADPTAQRFFENAAPFVIRRKGDATPIPQNWHAMLVRSYTSYANIKRAFDNGAIDPDVRAILYDNEHWQFTPDEEQRGHARFTQMAAELVHAHGLQFIAAPAVNLTQVLAAQGSAKRYDAYVSANVARDAARYADVYEIQAQGSEKDAGKYAAFVRAAAAQAREANPKITVLAGISTNPSGQSVTAGDILGAIDATRSAVDGYWFNIPHPSEYCPRCNDFRPDIAIEVFKRLGTDAK